jgi:hypothetical protein
MPFVYIVRCNFAAPEKEAAWNAWYSGPKIAQMLAQPYFLSCQRFKRAAGAGRDYLALWTMQSPEALTTPEYKAQWGFSEWTPDITDWSRDLFDAGGASERVFAIVAAGALHVVSFDGASEDEAIAARAALARPPNTMWLPVIGLDRHTPLIGLSPLPDESAVRLPDDAAGPCAQQAIYRPISGFHRAAR